MTYYHVMIEVRENLGKNDEIREINLFDVTDLQSIIPTILRPYLTHTTLHIDDEHVPYSNIKHFSVKQTALPIQQLIEAEQRELPSNTDISISAYEIFNDKELAQDVTQVIIDLLDE